MTEMPPDSPSLASTDRLLDALTSFLTCMHAAVPDICSSSLIHGESYVPFDPDSDSDCSADDAACSQLWVRISNAAPLLQPGWHPGCSIEMQMTLEVGVIRCIDIPEGGEAPTETDVFAAAVQSTTDMDALLHAALCCDVWTSLDSPAWSPLGPLGGQFGGTWAFTVTL